MKKKILFLIVFSAVISVFSQSKPFINNIDSLLDVLKGAKDDTGKVNLLDEIAHYYSTKNLEKAVEYSEQSLFLSKQIKFRKGEAVALLQIGMLNNDLGKISSAISNFEAALQITNEDEDKKFRSAVYNNLGMSYFNLSEFDKALEQYFSSLKIAEELNDLKIMSTGYNNIANVYIRQKRNEKALEYHLKGLEIAEKLGHKTLIAGSYNNIGIVYNNMKQPQKALEYYFKTLEIAVEIGHKLGQSFTLNNLGSTYSEMKQYDKALEYFKKALVIKKEIGEQKGIANTLSSIGSVYIEQNKPDEAIKCFNQSIEIAKEVGEKLTLEKAYSEIANAYSLKNDFKKAFEFQKSVASLKDSVYNEESSSKIAEMTAKFENEKKEKEIKLQAIEIEKKDVVMKQQNTQRNALMAGIALVIALAVAIFISLKQKQQTNKILTLQNQKISHQKKIIEKAHSILQNKNNDITESIIYAQRIQQAILPLNEDIINAFPESFVIYKPRDIVSGDFYWFSQIENFFVLAVADCTGHGVPGAFMSMMGIDLLNQIVHDESVHSPAEALELMDRRISKSLGKSKDFPNTSDGIDIALCAIHPKENSLRFAGANRPLFLLRNGNLNEYKASHKTVGIVSEHDEPCLMHNISIEKGDCIYLFTDGFADQFGGGKGKKFMTKRFKELLLSISGKPMDEQKQIITNMFAQWKGELKQVDDVCVIGVRV